MSLTLLEQRTGRDLVDPALFDRLTTHVAVDAHTDTITAERIVDQALAFLAACAVTTSPLSPSAAVDHGWHAFILHTREYAAFCNRVAGRFIHHVPAGEHDCQKCQQCNTCQDEKPPSGKVLPDALSARLSSLAVAEAGFFVDEPMWAAASNCSQCHNGCHNDPPPNPPSFI